MASFRMLIIESDEVLVPRFGESLRADKKFFRKKRDPQRGFNGAIVGGFKALPI
jgi:hypothetical protein